MIIRIVKLSFAPEKVETFLSIFKKYEEKISSFEGCIQLELLNDINNPNVYFTYSYWQEEAFLGAYRDSDLFKDVWGQTKVLFNNKPEAWSVKRV